ncbi:MAG: hypothetical protein FJ091_07240 [Deltaproteobacteria bacterium]|nr:hypothetical protein [Deltaproteobacteria bacterium]
MSAASAYVDEIRPSALSKLAIPALVLAVAGLAIGFTQGDAATFWRSFHVNYLYFGLIAQGAVVLSCIFTIVGAKWPGPIRRLAESLGLWTVVTPFLFLADWFVGRTHIYPWLPVFEMKPVWLNEPRLLWWNLGFMVVLAILSQVFLASSRVTATPDASDEQKAVARNRMKNLAPLICLAYAFGWSIITFDQIMSLTPTWFSNLFGAFVAWGGLLSAVTMTTILAVLHRNYPGLEGQITKDRLHDLGKLIFAFSIFWMYLFFSQYLVIWYGNLPEETQFFETRLGSEFLMDTWYWAGWWERINEPWVKVSLAAWIGIWVIPFWCLLGQVPKKTWWFVSTIAGVSLVGFWIERNVLIWPSLEPKNDASFLGVPQIAVALGFLGAFCFVQMLYRSRFMAVPAKHH